MRLVSVPGCCSALQGSLKSGIKLLFLKREASSRSMPAPRLQPKAPSVLPAGLLQLETSMARKVKQRKTDQNTRRALYTCERKTNSYSVLRAEQRPLPSGRLAEWQRGAVRIAPPAGSRRRGARSVRPGGGGGASWWFGFIYFPEFAQK